jgi:hypothetical protein
MSNEENCYATIWTSWGRARQCSREGKFTEERKLWCGQHVPSKVKARRKKADQKYQAQQEQVAKRERFWELDNVAGELELVGKYELAQEIRAALKERYL